MSPLYKKALTGCISLLIATQAVSFYLIAHLATKSAAQQFVEVSRRADLATVVVGTKTSMGAGIIISKKGYILTCYHVIAGAQDHNVTITFFDDKREVPGLVLWQDYELDLALVKVKQKDLSAKFEVLTLASTDPQVGEQVLTIGHPLGNLWTVAQGVVSKYTSSPSMPIFTKKILFLQTDALMHPGSSGGAVVNSRGQVVGICDRVATERAPIYVPLFIDDAISASTIHQFLQELPRDISDALNIS